MSVLTVIIIVVLAFGASVLLWRKGAQPQRHRRVRAVNLDRFLLALLERGNPGAVLYIEAAAKKGAFLQFAKYQDDGKVGLQFAFPCAPWSAGIFALVAEAIDSAGYAILKRPVEGAGEVREFLLVDLGPDIRKATRLAGVVVPVVFGVREDEPILELYFRGVRAE